MKHLIPIAILFVCLSACSATRADELRDKLKDLASDILSETRGQPVKILQFVSSVGTDDANSGAGLEQLLIEMLEATRSGSVNERAQLFVQGTYSFVPRSRTASDFRVVKLKVTILDAFGEEINKVDLEAQFDFTKAIMEIVQPTVALPDPARSDVSKEDRNRKLQESVLDPKVRIHGPGKTRVSAVRDQGTSPFSIEVRACPLSEFEKGVDPRSRPVRDEDGQAFIDLDLDDLYEILIHNESDQQIAARVMIDGIDIFQFSEDRNEDGTPKYTHFIAPPKSSMLVKGWHKSIADPEANVRSFLVKAHGKGVVSNEDGIKPTGRVGVIFVEFCKARQLAPGARSTAQTETGFGPDRRDEQVEVRADIDPPLEAVAIRYSR